MAVASREIVLRWMSKGLTDERSALVMALVVPSDNKAITWANVDSDLCRHMASLGHIELMIYGIPRNIFQWNFN